MAPSSPGSSNQTSGKRRSPRRRRFLACPVHADEALLGNGQKYFLHLLTSEQLQQRGMAARKARLVIQAYPVLVLSNEWLENLYCRCCEQLRWCHVVRQLDGSHRVSWASRDLWQQVAHVDPSMVNPSVSEFSRREARLRSRRLWGQV